MTSVSLSIPGEHVGPLIPFAQIPGLPLLRNTRRRGGRKLHLSTVHRWHQHGVSGRRLRAVRIGGQLATTEAWLLEFFETLASSPVASSAVRSPVRRHRESEAAKQRLQSKGF